MLVFVVCVVYLGIYTYNSNRALDHFEELEQIVQSDASQNEPEETENGDDEPTVVYELNEEGKLTCYAELSNRNNEMVGWIKIAGTQINYPVMQQKGNNSFYLNHNFDKLKQSGGLPTLDYQCDIDKPTDNLIIYGHNMRNGSVFSALTKYKKKEFFDDHKTIVLDTLYEHREYEVMAVFNTKVGSAKEFRYHEFVETFSEESFNEYIKGVKERAIHKTETDAIFGDTLLTLSTCSYGTSNERMVVVAKRVL